MPQCGSNALRLCPERLLCGRERLRIGVERFAVAESCGCLAGGPIHAQSYPEP